jgi:hypothetical protein
VFQDLISNPHHAAQSQQQIEEFFRRALTREGELVDSIKILKNEVRIS